MAVGCKTIPCGSSEDGKGSFNTKDIQTNQVIVPGSKLPILDRHIGKGKVYSAYVLLDSEDARIIFKYDSVTFDFSPAELNRTRRYGNSDRLWWLSVYNIEDNLFCVNLSPSVPLSYFGCLEFEVRNLAPAGNVTVIDAQCERVVICSEKALGSMMKGV